MLQPVAPVHKPTLILATVCSAALHLGLIFGSPMHATDEQATAAKTPLALVPFQILRPPEPPEISQSQESQESQESPDPSPLPKDEAEEHPLDAPPEKPTTPAQDTILAAAADRPPTALAEETRPPVADPQSIAQAPAAPVPDILDSSTPSEPVDLGNGNFAAPGRGPAGPVLRIDWGSPSQAIGLIRRTGIQLAVLNHRSPRRLTHGVGWGQEGQAARASLPNLAAYDREARVVDDSPAFSGIARDLGLRSGEYLVLLFPQKLATEVRLAQRRAVRSAGYDWEQVAVTAGRFEPSANGPPRMSITQLRLIGSP